MKKLFLIILLASCSSFSEKVVQRIDDVDEKPHWASISKSTWIENGRMYAVGLHEANEGARIPALIRVSDNNARFEISRKITNEMAFILQNMEEGVEEGESLTRFYGAEVSKMIAHGINQEKRYWEKVLVPGLDGRELKIRTFSLVSISQADLNKAIREALNKDRGLDPKIKQQMTDHLARELNKLGQ